MHILNVSIYEPYTMKKGGNTWSLYHSISLHVHPVYISLKLVPDIVLVPAALLITKKGEYLLSLGSVK